MTYFLKSTKPFPKSDFLPYEHFFKDFTCQSDAISSAIEAMHDDDTPVLVIEKETGKVIWDSSKAQFEDDGFDRNTYCE